MYNIIEILRTYSLKDISIATLSSHSALQILKGAKDEGLRTILICDEKRFSFYSQFTNLVDKFIIIKSFNEIENVVPRLIKENTIFVPHGSAVEYIGLDTFLNLKLPIFGNRYLIKWESNQRLKMKLLRESGIPIPREYSFNENFNSLVIVKLSGAKGGKFFFISSSSTEVREKIQEYLSKGIIKDVNDVIIQEYVIGVPMYFHYFYSPILNRLEILGIDIRYETNVDGLRRLPIEYAKNIKPSFIVVGNIPVVIREKMLTKVYEYGVNFVNKFKEIEPPGVIGPFSLESIVVNDETIVVFEFSGRIVAGTNIYVGMGSPYSWFYWNEPMYMGKRIAREIKLATEHGLDMLCKVIT